MKRHHYYLIEHVEQLFENDSDSEELQNEEYLTVEEKLNDNSDEHFQDLALHFNKLCSKNAKICQPAYDSKVNYFITVFLMTIWEAELLKLEVNFSLVIYPFFREKFLFTFASGLFLVIWT